VIVWVFLAMKIILSVAAASRVLATEAVGVVIPVPLMRRLLPEMEATLVAELVTVIFV